MDDSLAFMSSLVNKVRRLPGCSSAKQGRRTNARSSPRSSSDEGDEPSSSSPNSCIDLFLPATYPPQIAIRYARERTRYPPCALDFVFNYHAAADSGAASPPNGKAVRRSKSRQSSNSSMNQSRTSSLFHSLAHTATSSVPYSVEFFPPSPSHLYASSSNVTVNNAPSSPTGFGTPTSLSRQSSVGRLQKLSSPLSRWDSALDLACGHGPLAFHLNTRFAQVYGRDPDAEAIIIARSLQQLDPDEVDPDLFPVQQSNSINFGTGSALDSNLEPGSVDLITIGSAAHKFDWSSTQSRQSLWTSWARLLRPGGTLAVLGLRLVIADVVHSDTNHPDPNQRGLSCARELQGYFDALPEHPSLARFFSKHAASLGARDLYSSLPLPWDDDDDEGQHDRHSLWSKGSQQYERYQTPSQDAKPTALSARLRWFRSLAGYRTYLSSSPAELVASRHDNDIIGRGVKQICRKHGWHTLQACFLRLEVQSGVFALRRSSKEWDGSYTL
ncbi:hypothetical protein OC861_001901 [Tilletia horrida]|nr:hypothetical protein OC861_001901 [Tilletia horrida]